MLSGEDEEENDDDNDDDYVYDTDGGKEGEQK